MPFISSSATPLEETDWYRSGGHGEWVERNRRWGVAYRFLKVYEGDDPRILELKRKISRDRSAEKPEDRMPQLLTPMETEEAYDLSRGYPEPPPPPEDGEEEKPKRVKSLATADYKGMAQRVREQGLVPISDAHRAELRRKLEHLVVGVHCEFVYITDKTHLTRKGVFVGYDDEFITLMNEKGTFYKVPIDKVFHGTYNHIEQGGKIK